MEHVGGPYNPLTSRPGRRSVPYPTSPRMSEPPFKPTSSLRHRRQSSIVMSTELTMPPSNYGGGAEWQGNGDVEAASKTLGGAMSGEGGKEGNIGNTDDEGLAKIAQAMTLLSLHPTQTSGSVLQPSPSEYRSEPTSSLAPWPSPEELLKESLRQSLSALHALGRIKSLVENLPSSEEEEEETGGKGGKGEIAQIMGFYDRAVGEMRAAGEILNWAQQYLSEEKEVVRERLLKG